MPIRVTIAASSFACIAALAWASTNAVVPARADVVWASEAPTTKAGIQTTRGTKIAAGPNQPNVGPGAIGISAAKTVSGIALRDGRSYPFAREIAASAIYDGVKVDGPHLLIEGVAFSGALDIYTKRPVVLRGVTIRPIARTFLALLVRPGAGPVSVLYSEIDGGPTNVDVAVALRGNDARVMKSRIGGASDGIQINGQHVVISDNIIAARRAREGDHNDSIQLLGAPQDVEISGNRITNPNPQTSCITILGRNIRVRGNYLAGGGYTIYGGEDNNGHGNGGATAVDVTSNVFSRDYFPKSGNFGVVAYWDKRNLWRGNRFDDGTAIPAP